MKKSDLFSSSEIDEAVKKTSLLAFENALANIPQDMADAYKKKMEGKEYPTTQKKTQINLYNPQTYFFSPDSSVTFKQRSKAI